MIVIDMPRLRFICFMYHMPCDINITRAVAMRPLLLFRDCSTAAVFAFPANSATHWLACARCCCDADATCNSVTTTTQEETQMRRLRGVGEQWRM